MLKFAPCAPRRREKLFGTGRPRPLDRNAKAKILARARALMRPTLAGRAYGLVTAKGYAVLGALLYGFHNAATGLCFPSLASIAAAASCAVSTVKRALADLEAAGVLTWVNRLARVRSRDALGRPCLKVVRTSNAYAFAPVAGGQSSKADLRPGTLNQDSLSLVLAGPKAPTIGAAPDPALDGALARLARLAGFRRAPEKTA